MVHVTCRNSAIRMFNPVEFPGIHHPIHPSHVGTKAQKARPGPRHAQAEPRTHTANQNEVILESHRACCSPPPPLSTDTSSTIHTQSRPDTNEKRCELIS